MSTQQKSAKQLGFGLGKADNITYATVWAVPSQIVKPTNGVHVFSVTRSNFSVAEIKKLLKAARLQYESDEIINAIKKFTVKKTT